MLSLPGDLGSGIFTFGIPVSTERADWAVCPGVAMEKSGRLEEYREESGNNITVLPVGAVLASEGEDVKNGR